MGEEEEDDYEEGQGQVMGLHCHIYCASDLTTGSSRKEDVLTSAEEKRELVSS